MKNPMFRIPSAIVLTAILAASASGTYAAGLLGQRYVGANLDYVIWDGDVGLDNGLGTTLIYNQPLARALDLNISYSYLSADFEVGDGSVRGHDFQFGATWFTPLTNGNFYTRAALGWAKASSAGFSDSTTIWDLEAGIEFPLGSSASVRPFISYGDAFESGFDGTWDFGVAGEFDLNNTTGLVIKVSVNDDSDVGISGGVVIRF